MTRKLSVFFSLFLAIGIFATVNMAQTTGFVYQGSLNSGGVVANGNHDFEFALFDALSGGAQLGATLPQNGIAVTNGIFAVSLDFGSQFPGAQRFLEIRVRPTGGGAFTPLTPRQQITSSPYAVKSLNSDTATTATNATQLGGVAASQYLQTNGNGSGLTNLDATSVTTGTLNNARLGLIPTANIADSAVTAPKIASGQIVKSLNTLKDDVSLAAGSNITITPAGNTLTIASTSGGGGGVTTVTASGPLASSGGATPNISLTGAVTAANGGTGLSSAGTAGNLLRSNGTAWTSAPLQAADVPADSGNYIQNRAATPQAGGNFNISGDGSIGQNFAVGGFARLLGGAAITGGGATITGLNGDGAVLTARRSGGDPYVIIDSTTVSQSPVLAYRKGNFNRWLMFANSFPESGGNEGSDFQLDAYNNAGGIANYFFIKRATGNVGIGAPDPSAYGHGGTNKLVEIRNPAGAVNSQAHAILSTGSTGAGSSIGSVTWAVPNTAGAEKRAALVASNIEGSAASSVTSSLTFWTTNAGAIGQKMKITPEGDVIFSGAIDIGYQIVQTTGNDAFCPAGKKALGGGGFITGDGALTRSFPTGNGWHVDTINIGGGFISVSTYAVCAKVK